MTDNPPLQDLLNDTRRKHICYLYLFILFSLVCIILSTLSVILYLNKASEQRWAIHNMYHDACFLGLDKLQRTYQASVVPLLKISIQHFIYCSALNAVKQA